jgi:hypothetical protein
LILKKLQALFLLKATNKIISSSAVAKAKEKLIIKEIE